MNSLPQYRSRPASPQGERPNPFLQALAENAQTATRGSGAAVAWFVRRRLVCAASSGAGTLPVGTLVDFRSSLNAECMRSGKPLCCDDSETDPRVDAVVCRTLKVRSILALRILVRGRVSGLIEVFDKQPRAFRSSDLEAVEQLVRTTVKQMIATDLHECFPWASDSVSGNPIAVCDVSSSASPPHDARKRDQAAASWPRMDLSMWMLNAAAIILCAAGGSIMAQRLTKVYKLGSPSTSRHQALLVAQTRTNAGTYASASATQPEVSVPNAELEFKTGAKYAVGEGVPRDYSEAIKWYAKAADHGSVQAQSLLGECYWKGRGVPRDDVLAYMWSAISRAGGDSVSVYRIELLSSEMKHSDIDHAKDRASDWLRQHGFSATPPHSTSSAE